MPNEIGLQPASDDQPNRPMDCRGAALSAFDIVRLLRLPDYIWADADSEQIKAAYQGYLQCYGLIKYAPYPDKDGWRRWYGPNGLILIEVVKVVDDVATAYEFVVPPDCVERIPYNAIIMNVFGNFDWQVHWRALSPVGSGEVQDWNPRPPEETEWPIKSGTKVFEVIKSILETPYEKLVAAHNEAARIMPALKDVN